ncbi:MAG: DUF4430 domain-containing protein, partial [archaeon GB-1867-035]|nr:DUF4430 domain-containing protein [Candidatus Culexmicrobium profundum]
MKIKSPWIITGLILIWAILATTIATQYYMENEKIEKVYREEKTILNEIKTKLNDLTDSLMKTLEIAMYSNNANLTSKINECIENLEKILDLIEETITVNIGIDYGNGSRIWFNSTKIKLGSTLFNATTKIAEVKYTSYSFGIFIDSINNLENNPSKSMYWIWWYWDSKENKWKLGQIGCDKYILTDK